MRSTDPKTSVDGLFSASLKVANYGKSSPTRAPSIMYRRSPLIFSHRLHLYRNSTPPRQLIYFRVFQKAIGFAIGDVQRFRVSTMRRSMVHKNPNSTARSIKKEHIEIQYLRSRHYCQSWRL